MALVTIIPKVISQYLEDVSLVNDTVVLHSVIVVDVVTVVVVRGSSWEETELDNLVNCVREPVSCWRKQLEAFRCTYIGLCKARSVGRTEVRKERTLVERATIKNELFGKFGNKLSGLWRVKGLLYKYITYLPIIPKWLTSLELFVSRQWVTSWTRVVSHNHYTRAPALVLVCIISYGIL